MLILNLTQHPATPDQIQAGVVDLPQQWRTLLQSMLTFDELPTANVVATRAKTIAEFALSHLNHLDQGTQDTYAMIGGAPFLMSALELELQLVGITPLYAYSTRVSEEVQNPDGTTTKTNVFKHLGFVNLY